mgnify:FL=1
MAKSDHKTAAYKIVSTETGNVYKFFCERSGQLICTTKPYCERTPEAELEKAWQSEGIRNFNRCVKCGRWVNTVMFNPDVLMCVDCAPIEAAPNFCPHCGTKVEEKADKCVLCGKKLVYEGVI